MSFPYGVSISAKLVTTALSSLGIIIQRKSHVKNDEKPLTQRKSSVKRPLWHLGFWLYLSTSAVGNVFSITSLPILVIAPLGTFSLLFNAVYAHFLLDENMTLIGFIGTVIVAGASAGIAILLHLPQHSKNSQQLAALLTSTGYIIYIVITAILLVIMVITGIHLTKVHKKNHSILSTEKERRLRLKIAVFFELSSTILASQALIFAKLSFDLLDLSIKTSINQFKDAVSIISLIVTAISTVLQLYFFNVSLHYYTTVVVIPIGYSAGITLACLNTFVYYDSFTQLTIGKTIAVLVLVATIIIGIILLFSKTSTSTHTADPTQVGILDRDINETPTPIPNLPPSTSVAPIGKVIILSTNRKLNKSNI